MFTILSLVTTVKDYVEVANKLVEADSSQQLRTYFDFGAIVTYGVIVGKQFLLDFLSFQWLQSLWSLPIVIPTIASSMISEVSVLDGYFHNAFTFLETPISYGNQNVVWYCLEKFTIGLLNSVFLCLPTSTAHLICFRRFVMQGLEAGYIAGLGTIAGNMVWIGSVIFGFRFFVIPWLSFDLFRYFLGFVLLIKYMWDSYTEKRFVLEDISKSKIFLLNFLLAFTEQTNIYPFISNLSIGSDSTMLESFPANNLLEFISIHSFYLLGIFIGSLSLLQFTCWFWENPAFNMYMWLISSFKVTTNVYYKFVNFGFLYLTMICAMSSVAYFGLDYTLTNPIGFVHEDRLLDQKSLIETSFLNTKASDRNTRRNRGRHGRRERWKRRIRRYRTFDTSLYDQGVYDLLTLEDLNYGFDRFWLRRKMRNHGVRFRFFPGPWMRSFKKQLSKPRLESFMGPRVEFFRILFEQVYHPEFHEYQKNRPSPLAEGQSAKGLLAQPNKSRRLTLTNGLLAGATSNSKSAEKNSSIYSDSRIQFTKKSLAKEHSTLRKLLRKVETRFQTAAILADVEKKTFFQKRIQQSTEPVYSKRWKHFFSKLAHDPKLREQSLWNQMKFEILIKNSKKNSNLNQFFEKNQLLTKSFEPSNGNAKFASSIEKNMAMKMLSKKDRQILRYRTFLANFNDISTVNQEKVEKILTYQLKFDKDKTKHDLNFDKFQSKNEMRSQGTKNKKNLTQPITIQSAGATALHPLKFYLQKEKAFQRKLNFYGVQIFRNFQVENNAPYFRVMMKRFFYHYKPTARWERTMRTATLRKARRKGPRLPRKLAGLSKDFAFERSALAASAISKSNKDSSMLSSGMDSPSPMAEAESAERPLAEGLLAEVNKQSSITNQIQKPTHFYSLVNKRATRYRYQIYKDVLQHWYYSPFNRLLLKFDVDSFIKRQPSSHFLTKKEEHLLHLRRFLLTEHYDTLRWYTAMQHYRSMKEKIGGTKSFASRVYNQQFQGTFKKIRHLFSITPSSSENMILKFDQPLYNEFSNEKSTSLVGSSFVHEELLADDFSFDNPKLSADDLVGQSSKIVREYLTQAIPIRRNLIQQLIQEKNSLELTDFLLKGQKSRGTQPITNEKSWANQENTSLKLNLAPLDSVGSRFIVVNNVANKIGKDKELKSKDPLFDKMQNNTKEFFHSKMDSVKTIRPKTDIELSQDLWITLMKKCQNQLYNQESLKIYLSRRVEKRQRQKQYQQKLLKLRLEKLKKWFLVPTNKTTSDLSLLSPKTKKLLNTGPSSKVNPLLKTGIQKAIQEGIFLQKNIKSVKLNVRQNRPEFQLPFLKNFTTSHAQMQKLENLKMHLQYQTKAKVFQTQLIEQDLKKSIQILQNQIQKNTKSQNQTFASRYSKIKQLVHKVLLPLNMISQKTQQNIIRPSISFLQISVTSKSSKDLPFWRQQEMALTKRKKTRKKFDRLTNTKTKQEKSIATNSLRSYNSQLIPLAEALRAERPLVDSTQNLIPENQPSRQKIDKTIESWRMYQKQMTRVEPSKESTLFSNLSGPLFENFKRKRSRARFKVPSKRRERIKKRSLVDKLRRQFRLFKKYGKTPDHEQKKMEIFQLITKRKYEPNSLFEPREFKQQRTRQRKHRAWKKSKKPNYAQNRRKQRKRRRYSVGKIRNLMKKLKRIKAHSQIQQWWWQTFLPNFQAKTEIINQIEKDQRLQKAILNMTASEIMERDFQMSQNFIQKVPNENKLQIGNTDYLPLSVPEAFRIREQLIQKQKLSFAKQNSLPLSEVQSAENPMANPTNFTASAKNNDSSLNSPSDPKNSNLIPQLSEKFLTPAISNEELTQLTDTNLFLVPIHPMPFYAGWDETLRKFVVTNRLLSRKDATYKMTANSSLKNQETNYLNSGKFSTIFGKNEKTSIEFINAPLQGMNAATTLYWQIPFTTYDPDQFFALGMDGFSPINWRRFSFNHFKETATPILVKMQTLAAKNFESHLGGDLSYNIQMKLLNSPFDQSSVPNTNKIDNNKLTHLNKIRRTQKRYKRVKKHPRPPVWFPSGALTNQILPVHYIYVFYKRARLPRDRYLSRRLRNQKEEPLSIALTKSPLSKSFSKMTDFTLRKRIKPKRKYHRKQHFRKVETLLLKRRMFRGFPRESLRSRPFSKIQMMSQTDPQSLQFKAKQRRKSKANKQQTENIRIRQLRRRVQRQVIRPIWRYKPRVGGFAWPGDYLRLELVDAPKLMTSNQQITTGPRQIRKTKRKRIQEWQIQPKKYLIEKHNLQVLKKRLEKSQNTHQIHQKVTRFKSFLN
jgi:hypothetical protein